MSHPEETTAPDWMRLAETDLESARVLAAQEPPLIEQALTLAQQAGEKALKALIAAKGVTPPRGHDLEALLDRVVINDASLESARDEAALLTRYAVAPRYPEPGVSYSVNEGISAIAAAASILAATREALNA